MHIFHDLNEWMVYRQQIPATRSIGFAPTMGNLHPGHASLFVNSKKDNDYTVSSLFINPTQFNKPDDFSHYPRTLEADLQLMERSGVDFCLLPTEAQMYADNYTYQLHEQQLSQLMEGQYRPGHFNGVLTVVMKLFNLTRPTRAYFGEKDYQQFLLIQGMVKALFMNIELHACPTIRESSGLAYSSRNNRLSSKERQCADEFARIFHQDKPCALIKDELMAKNISVEYIEEYIDRRFAAVLIGAVRLIDNYSIA